jgi:hypothetical protein
MYGGRRGRWIWDCEAQLREKEQLGGEATGEEEARGGVAPEGGGCAVAEEDRRPPEAVEECSGEAGSPEGAGAAHEFFFDNIGAGGCAA